MQLNRERDLAENDEMLVAMLFWLEFLHRWPRTTRDTCEAVLRDRAEPSPRIESAVRTVIWDANAGIVGAAVSGLLRVVQLDAYESLKHEIERFVLPHGYSAVPPENSVLLTV